MSQLAFRYTAIDPRGGSAKGVLQAATQEDAYRQIVASGLKPLSIKGMRGRGGRRKKITLKDVAHFSHQFAVMMDARMPIVDGLRSIVDQDPNERLREVVQDVARQIEGGSTVTEALTPHREMFGEVFVETVRAAERSGSMVEVLDLLATLLERQYEMTKSVKGAMIYPICVIVSLVGAVTFLMIFVIPTFADMFARRNLPLPLPTQIVIFVSNTVRVYWYVFAGGLGGGIWMLRRAWKKPASRARIDSFLHRIPFVRDLLKGLAIGRFSNVLGISLRSGLSLIDALEMAGRASARPLLQAEAEKLRDQVNTGGRLSDVLVTCQYLPSFTRRMISAGEETGELPKMCEIIARNYDREVEHLAKNVTTVIEPLLIVGLAGIVLVIALAIFLPMWNMGALMGT